MSATAWPRIKRGNPYRRAWTFSFSEGSIVGCVALLMIKRFESDADADALVTAASEAITGLTLNGTLTLSAGVEPLTATVAIDIPADVTATLPARELVIGLQINQPNGDPLEFDDDLLEKTVEVSWDAVRYVPPAP